MALALWRRPSSREGVLRDRIALLETQVHQRLSMPIVQVGEPFVGFGDSSNATKILEAMRGATATAIRVIRQRIQGLELGVFTRRFVDGKLEDTPAFDHPLQRLLDEPTRDEEGNVTHTADQMWGLAVTQQQALGEAYLHVIHDGLGVPMNLQSIKPGTVQPLVEKGQIVAYDLTGQQSQRLSPRDLIRIWDPHPEDLFTSLGVMIRQAEVIELDLFSTRSWRKFYQNDATPKLAFVAKEVSEEFPTPDEQDAVGRVWSRRFNNLVGKWLGVPAWVLPGWDVKQLSSQDEATAGVTLMQYARRTAFQAFGVPPSLAGDVVDVNRAAAETSRYTFDVNTIEPITKQIANALTGQLAPQYANANGNGDVRLIVKYRPFIQRDKAFDLQRDEIDLQTKTRSINEVRAAREPELPAASWGDLPVGSVADVPYTGEEEELDLSGFTFEEPSETEEETAEEIVEVLEEEEERTRGHSVKMMRAHFAPQLEWERVLRRDVFFTPKFLTAQKSLFRRQGQIVMERFLKMTRGERQDGEDLAAELFPLAGWEDLFEQSTEPVRVESYVASATEATQAITGRRFILTEAARAEVFRLNLTHISFINSHTQTVLALQLDEGLALGESTDQIAARITKVFNKRRTDARRIARTEIAGAVQAAQVQGYRQSGVVEQKMWNTSLDGDVRDSHDALQGEVRNLDDPFTDSIEAPAIASNPGDRVNCRCFLTPVFVEEES